MYYLRKSREAYAIYQTVEEEEVNEEAYVTAYRFLDYGTVASNILMITMLCCLAIVTSPVIENIYLFIFSLVLMFFAFAVAIIVCEQFFSFASINYLFSRLQKKSCLFWVVTMRERSRQKWRMLI